MADFDDVVSAVEAVTAAECHPGLHSFDGIPEIAQLAIEQEATIATSTHHRQPCRPPAARCPLPAAGTLPGRLAPPRSAHRYLTSA
ncbi:MULTISPECIES: hypothetical protein [unclassified Streptomyces]|uniref:hypothetical protein n=1 Tax=unclassified Streptomyces TaxID=2593676 RepID=UPI0022598D47|nr:MULTISPECIES: hypothetical protein [unclassified Streptomyces]WSP56550.1 hypothetical protein OG306_20945 [Streptomyces sp. NBC_01241]WSU22733.1 hypothetical protein OG508_18290 [Streptomyces sp. NBC_01108]MCX4788296.1 hypothetical protein [Streptomyces sp. NBC_01221]MCX4795946.1 hypothetical protein [Streptomyces sp. NBC_01242]WSJ37224.1 hypothetical protein OG772_14990 [Streptomyces sp. NBC_01321]